MKIVILDAATLGPEVDLSPLDRVGEVVKYSLTTEAELADRVADAEIIVSNKQRLNRSDLAGAEKLKLICITATGYDCIDTAYCRERRIGVCNVPGYSTASVAQLTLTMALSLTAHLEEYRAYVNSGAYSRDGVANYLIPVWRELAGKTWGVIGGGSIARQVAGLAQALGCQVLMCRRRAETAYEAVDLESLCEKADIISVHVPLTTETRGMIGAEQIRKMKKDAVFINVARGAVCDEEALTLAIEENRLGGLGVDVFSTEPFPEEHPYSRILGRPNVCLTPHMAWSALEARNRCIAIVSENIRDFLAGKQTNRVENLE